MTQSPAQLLKKARKKLALNQTEFAEQLGKTQGTLSRYESGSVPPPSEVIMHCMHILNSDPTSDSVDDLIEKIGQLRGDQYAKLREALNTLLDGYLNPH
jgi:transcriptional regulator with XRE-family HTH domain